MNQIFTRSTALFQRNLIELVADRKPPLHNLAYCNADAQIDMVKLSLFTRRCLGNHYNNMLKFSE